MPDVQGYKQRRYLLHNARILQFSTVQCANSGNFLVQFTCRIARLIVVAANNYIAVDTDVGAEQFGGDIVKRGNH